MPSIPRAAYTAALDKAKAWLKRPDVTGVGIGLQNQNRVQTNVKCISVKVRWKRTLERLAALKIKPLPRNISVQVRGRKHTIPVDIEGAGGRKLGTLHGIVGLPLTATPVGTHFGDNGMVGAIIKKQGQPCILAAGHVVRSPGATVSVQLANNTLEGTATDVFLTGSLDHALIAPAVPLPPRANQLPSGQSITGLRDTSGLIHGEVVSFFDKHGTLHSVRIKSINQHTTFRLTSSTTLSFDDLVEVDSAQSRKGDSGTLLFDEDFLAVGTLVGSIHSWDYFVPCDLSFIAMNITLA